MDWGLRPASEVILRNHTHWHVTSDIIRRPIWVLQSGPKHYNARCIVAPFRHRYYPLDGFTEGWRSGNLSCGYQLRQTMVVFVPRRGLPSERPDLQVQRTKDADVAAAIK